MRSLNWRHRQKGAVLITVALVLLFLLGFMGIALDLGRLFIVKTELQTAMDSCALSAAQELDGLTDSIVRAKSAGVTAGNVNRVNLQSQDWNAQGQLLDTEILFRAANYSETGDPVNARYVQCQHVQPNIQMWLLHIMGAFNTPGFPNKRSVMAMAVATRASAQSTCPLPIALKPKAGGVSPNYGYANGEWVKLLMEQNAAAGGEIGWANLDGSNSASETVAELEGYCGTQVGDQLGTPGVQAAVADAWNYRFGIYKNNVDMGAKRPDFTGYAYTALNWPAKFNAYDGPKPAETPATLTSENFLAKRDTFASCADAGTNLNGPGGCEAITGLTFNSFQKLARPGAAALDGHRAFGTTRRMAVVPVINDELRVIDYACMFMLQPLSIPLVDVYLEYRGNAGAPGSPCTTAGLPGGSAGPLVPVLVR